MDVLDYDIIHYSKIDENQIGRKRIGGKRYSVSPSSMYKIQESFKLPMREKLNENSTSDTSCMP